MVKEKTIRAAGGVVWRRAYDGTVEVVLIHRPDYDDWSLPKGKRERSESDEQAALREVDEETGLHCYLGPELTSVSYDDHRGRPKHVRYWAMVAVSARPRKPDDEVDEVRWVPYEEVPALLTYPHDRTVAESLRAVLPWV